jgi:hypothetical protein
MSASLDLITSKGQIAITKNGVFTKQRRTQKSVFEM